MKFKLGIRRDYFVDLVSFCSDQRMKLEVETKFAPDKCASDHKSSDIGAVPLG